MKRPFAIVVAADEARGIGKDGTLPWRIPADLAFFKRLTSEAAPGKRNAVIMGRVTFASIPEKFRPLPGRLNVVLSHDPGYAPAGARAATSLEAALEGLAADESVDKIFVIGGAAVYAQALALPLCTRVHITRVRGTFGCDVYLPVFEDGFRLARSDGPHQDAGHGYTFELWER